VSRLLSIRDVSSGADQEGLNVNGCDFGYFVSRQCEQAGYSLLEAVHHWWLPAGRGGSADQLKTPVPDSPGITHVLIDLAPMQLRFSVVSALGTL
jgi:hypothetical protein